MTANLRHIRAEGTPERRIHVVQGEHYVTQDPDVMLTTILGSCVAACLRDRVSGIGGMNHFLLPGGEKRSGDDGMRYGVHAMELLVNNLLKLGARRDRLEAKLFGGARMLQGLTDVGELNASFAEDFLRRKESRYQAAACGVIEGVVFSIGRYPAVLGRSPSETKYKMYSKLSGSRFQHCLKQADWNFSDEQVTECRPIIRRYHHGLYRWSRAPLARGNSPTGRSRGLEDLGALAERVQEVLSPLIVEGCTSERLEQSQGLDLLTQSLFGLSAFLSALEPELAPSWRVSPLYAAKAVTLSGLSHRLSGLSVEQDSIKLLDDVCAGDCDLF